MPSKQENEMRRFAAAIGLMTAAAILCLTMALALSQRAAAQALCAPLPNLLAGIKARFDETPVFIGTAKDRRYIVTAAPSGSWTLIQVEPGGEPACIIAGGEGAKDPRGDAI